MNIIIYCIIACRSQCFPVSASENYAAIARLKNITTDDTILHPAIDYDSGISHISYGTSGNLIVFSSFNLYHTGSSYLKNYALNSNV